MKKIIIIIGLIFSVFITGCGSNGTNNKVPIETFVIQDINLEMIKCPAGKFMMGSPKEEYSKAKNDIHKYHKKVFGFEYNEKLHLVNITKPFYIGKYEVTQKQYSSLTGKNPSRFQNDNKPVEKVTHDEAKAFCDQLNSKYSNLIPKGYKFALPTEAQWEYACRAGTKTALNNDKDLTDYNKTCQNLNEIAWNMYNCGKSTSDVGKKKPNSWGIYDMHGNVWEWCNDWYGEYPDKEVIDPIGPASGKDKVNRGGSCGDGPSRCRSASRDFCNPKMSGCLLGFRVALVPID